MTGRLNIDAAYMVINYIILVHKEPAQLKRLIERLYAVDVYFYIHVDRNVSIQPFLNVLADIPRVKFLDHQQRIASVWGSFGLVAATMQLIEAVLNDNRQGYTILLSGQCYPIKPKEEFRKFLERNYGTNFIEGFALPDDRWPASGKRINHYTFFLSHKKNDFITVPSLTDLSVRNFFNGYLLWKYLKVIFRQPGKATVLLKKRRFPNHLQPVGGMQWWALPMETLRYVRHYISVNPGYTEYFKYSLIPDEMFFQTLVHNSFDNSGPPVSFSKWTNEQADSSPFTIQSCHLKILESANEFFARKFDLQADSEILDLIDKNLLAPKSKDTTTHKTAGADHPF